MISLEVTKESLLKVTMEEDLFRSIHQILMSVQLPPKRAQKER